MRKRKSKSKHLKPAKAAKPRKQKAIKSATEPEEEIPSAHEAYTFTTSTQTIIVNATSKFEAYKILRQLHPPETSGKLLKFTHHFPGGGKIDYNFHWLRSLWWRLRIM